MTLPERSLFSFLLSLGGEEVLGLEGGSSREVFELRVGRVTTDERVVGSMSVAVRCVRSGDEGGEGKKGTVFMWDSTRVEADWAAMPAPMSTSFRFSTMAFAMAQYHGVAENASRVLAISFIHPMRPTGGGIFFERTSVFERRFESSNEDSNSKIVFALIAIQLNPIESKLLGRIAAKAQQQQRAHQIDRRWPQICARKTQICARKRQICARKKGFFCFFN